MLGSQPDNYKNQRGSNCSTSSNISNSSSNSIYYPVQESNTHRSFKDFQFDENITSLVDSNSNSSFQSIQITRDTDIDADNPVRRLSKILKQIKEEQFDHLEKEKLLSSLTTKSKTSSTVIVPTNYYTQLYTSGDSGLLTKAIYFPLSIISTTANVIFNNNNNNIMSSTKPPRSSEELAQIAAQLEAFMEKYNREVNELSNDNIDNDNNDNNNNGTNSNNNSSTSLNGDDDEDEFHDAEASVIEGLKNTADIALGFESDSAMENFMAGFSLAQIVRSLDAELVAIVIKQLPIIVEILESKQTTLQISETLRLLAAVIEKDNFTRNAAAGLRLVIKALDDQEVFKAIEQTAKITSKVIENQQVSRAIAIGAAYATDILKSPTVAKYADQVAKNPQLSSSLTYTLDTGINAAKTLMENETAGAVANRSLGVANTVMSNQTVQSTLATGVHTGAYVANRVMESPAVQSAASYSASAAGAVVGNQYVQNAAITGLQWTVNAAQATGNVASSTYGFLYNTLGYHVQQADPTPEQKMQTLEEMKEDLVVCEQLFEEDMTNLRKEEIDLQKELNEAKKAYDLSRERAYANAVQQNKLINILDGKRVDVLKAEAEVNSVKDGIEKLSTNDEAVSTS